MHAELNTVRVTVVGVSAILEMFVWQMVVDIMKVGSRCVAVEYGEQCVMTVGAAVMQ